MFELGIDFARSLDAADPLREFRGRFAFPSPHSRDEVTYLVGNSLGLQPKRARDLMLQELDKWATAGVRGHFEGDRPWAPYHEFLAAPMARMVGALPEEVVVMNGLTVNLHLLMVSFYRPTAQRHKILIEEHAFPSDHFAVESQISTRGFDPAESLVTISPRAGEETLRPDAIVAAIEEHGSELALALMPGVQYYTGQVMPMAEIVAAAHRVGAMCGLDLAHAAGNVQLDLHEWGPDFAAWCTYKYLNGGPGATAGAFVHERHLGTPGIPRLHGWWGHDKETRFEMKNEFVPIPTAEAWQLSNAPIFSMTPLVASLAVFEDAGGMGPLREKSMKMVQYLDYLLDSELAGKVESITPREIDQRGCQMSLKVTAESKPGTEVFAALQDADVECDWRYPNVIRIAPVPLYNSFEDVHRFVAILKEAIG
ncbi:MAG: kynureninase [Acidimicrobiia bacterium]|nr:kynureninase [Acidimicrobiia bacterium]